MYVLLLFTGKPDQSVDLNVQSVTTTSIYINWRQPDYAIYNQTAFSIVYYTLLNQHSTRKYSSAVTEFNLTDLLPATSYVIYVIARNKYCNGEPTNRIIQKTKESGKK